MTGQARGKGLNLTMRNLRSFLATTTSLMLLACGGTHYVPPEKAEMSSTAFEVVVPYSFDATWQKVLNHVLRERYFIETYDRASETITVSFGRSDPGRFADCGLFYASPLLAYPAWQRELNALMQIRLNRVSPNETEVTTKATYTLDGYVFNVLDGKALMKKRAKWSFETGSFDERLFDDEFGEVACKPTHAAERAVIEAVLAE